MGVGAQREKLHRNALAKFRRFLLHQRGQLEPKLRRKEPGLPTQGLPAWLAEEISHYQHLCQRNWRAARLDENIRRFWSGHLRLWRFLCEQCGVRELDDIHRKQLYAYADARLEAKGLRLDGSTATCATSLGCCAFCRSRGTRCRRRCLGLRDLKQPERLPKFLTDDQVPLLRDDVESRGAQARFFYQRRDALPGPAPFSTCSGSADSPRRSGGAAPGRSGPEGTQAQRAQRQGHESRTVFLTGIAVQALQDYLPLHGEGPTDHVFLYRNQPLSKDLIHGRLKAAGQHVGVKVYAHRLRHTCATQLLNAGCPVTSIQKLLGHKKLNTTMVYAKAHDQTVEADYFAAMGRIEQRLELVEEEKKDPVTVTESTHGQLRSLAEQLFIPEMTLERRLEIAAQMCGLLGAASPEDWIPPPVPHEEKVF